MIYFLVDTDDPDNLDKFLNKFGAALSGGGMISGYETKDNHYIVCCWINPELIKFMINESYGKVIE